MSAMFESSDLSLLLLAKRRDEGDLDAASLSDDEDLDAEEEDEDLDDDDDELVDLDDEYDDVDEDDRPLRPGRYDE